MFPWRRRRDRGWSFFDELFGGMDDEFKNMEENMARIFEEMQKGGEGAEPGKPYVYGFSMRVGPDGKPHIEEFGNTKAGVTPGAEHTPEEREPLTDVIDKGEDIVVIAEIPGVEKTNIKLKATEKKLVIDVATPDRKYHKDLALPAEVEKDTSKATYKNGVLEVKLKKKAGEKPAKEEGVDVQVE